MSAPLPPSSNSGAFTVSLSTTPLDTTAELSSKILIDVRGASVTLRHEKLCHTVLHQVYFQLVAGQHCAIIGGNGSGKSTFLRLLRGEVWVDNPALNVNESQIIWHIQQGKNEASLPALASSTVEHSSVAEHSPIMGRRMVALVSAAKQEAYVRYEWRLNGEDILLTAFSDAELLHFIPETAQKEAVFSMAKKLKVTHLLHQEACTLSQGQLRLLLLGRALLRKPQVLLLDECMDGLDAHMRQHFLQLLEAYVQESGCTLVFTDHRPHGIPPWVQHRYSMQEGRLTAYAAPLEKKLETPASQVPPCTLQKGQTRQKTPTTPTMQTMQTMQTASAESTRASLEQEHSSTQNVPVFIRINEATVYIERKALLHNLAWTWRRGEHWMLHGENGSGKSTFLRLLAGQEHVAWGGTFERFQEREGRFISVQDIYEIQSCTALLSDKEQQCYGYDVTGLELVLSGLDHVQGVYRVYTEEEHSLAMQTLIEFHLQSLSDRRIRSLSTGQLRRLLLARLCIAEPQLLLLDEPFSGLDRTSYMAMRDMLEAQSQRVEKPAHILLVSHYQEDRLTCINRDAFMEKGFLS